MDEHQAKVEAFVGPDMTDDQMVQFAEVIFRLLRRMDGPADAMTIMTMVLLDIYDNYANGHRTIESFGEHVKKTLIDAYDGKVLQ